MAKKILSVIAYFLLYVISTLFFVYFTFPLDRLQAFIESKANSSAKYRLEMDGIEREGMSGLVLDGVRLGIHRKLLKRPGAQPAGAPLPGGSAPAALKMGKSDDITAGDEEEAAPKKAKTKSKKASDKAGEDGEEGTKASKKSAKGAGDEGEEEEDADKSEKVAAGASSDEFSFITIDVLRISYDLFDFITPSHFRIGIDAELLNGTIEGGELEFFEEHGMSRPAIRFPEIYALQLGDAELFGVLFSALLPSVKTDRVEGTLERGVVEMEPQLEEEHKSYSGRIELELSGIVALAPMLVNRVRNAPAVEVPLTDMRLGKCVFNIKIDSKEKIPILDKVATKDQAATAVLFEKGECKGESLDYFIKPNSYILLPEKGSILKGKLDLWTKLAFSPDYFEEKRVEDGQVMTRNQELGKGLEFDRTWQEAQDVEGYYWMHCQGSLGQPRCRRELPKEEKTKKDAQKEAERKRKAGKSSESVTRPVVGGTRPDKESAATRRETLLEQRREAARKRAGTSGAERTGSEEPAETNPAGDAGAELPVGSGREAFQRPSGATMPKFGAPVPGEVQGEEQPPEVPAEEPVPTVEGGQEGSVDENGNPLENAPTEEGGEAPPTDEALPPPEGEVPAPEGDPNAVPGEEGAVGVQ